ncbi:odorant receptor 13a-like isoform X1 [Athalia rosae]|uniref:odorant receptor 13a-like isoform X1 n=1 Tax=Athalia rosae TaxID=37344 RepID=UPI002033AC8D|nr:odorant receptor 13a-like isoform X1 [Athalia rosae]
MQNREVSIYAKFYDKYTNINKELLRTVGLWPQDEKRKDSIKRRGLAISYLLVLLGLTLTQFYHVYLIWDNFFDCLEILCNTTTSFLIIHKTIIFIWNRDIILNFESQGRRMWIAEFHDPNNVQIMIEAAKTAQKLTYIFLSIVIFTLTNFFIAPAVSVFYQWRSGVPPEEFHYVLPYLVKLPLDLHQPVQHAIGYIPTTICSITLIYYIAGIDSFYCTSVQHIVLHFKILARSLTQLQTIKHPNCGNAESVMNHLRSCVEKHDAIIKHSAVLEKIYSPIILGLGVISTLSMCMVIFHAVVTRGGHNGNIALFVMYFSMEVSEVLLYCWFGNTLTLASSEVGWALYNTDWYSAHQDKVAFASCLKIMMTRTQRPVKITAYKFADVSLKLFTNIMSTTASYFTLLRTLYQG